MAYRKSKFYVLWWIQNNLETMELGSLAMWWSPLIIVCPDYVYLSKLFLVLQNCPSRTLNNTKVRALWLRSMVGRHREAGCVSLGRGSARHGFTRSHGERPSWTQLWGDCRDPKTSYYLTYHQSNTLQIKLMGLEWGGWVMRQEKHSQILF